MALRGPIRKIGAKAGDLFLLRERLKINKTVSDIVNPIKGNIFMKTFKRLLFGISLLCPLFFAAVGWGAVPDALVGTWGHQILGYHSDTTWHTEANKITFNSNGSGILDYKFNDNGVFSSGTQNFTYTVDSNTDGSYIIWFTGQGETEAESSQIVISDDGTMIIGDGTDDSTMQEFEILIKLGTEGTYDNSDLIGDSYKIGYEHDANGGDRGYYRAESGITSSDGEGTLSFTADTLNGDGTLHYDSGGFVPYTVNSDGSVNIDGITGFLSGNGLCSLFSNPASTDDWMNVFAMVKGDKLYSTADLAGTWAFTGFGDYGGMVFNAEIGTMTCDSAGKSTYSLKMRQSDGSVFYVSGLETLSVVSDGSFGSSLAPGVPSYAGAIGNDGNTLIMNRSFNPNNLNERNIITAVKCEFCSNLAGGTADEQAIQTRFQDAITAYNEGKAQIDAFMSHFSTGYLDDGEDWNSLKTNVEEEFDDPDWEPITSYTMMVIVNGSTATADVIWADGEAETMHWLKEVDIWMIYGNQKKYGVDAWSQNWHSGQQYMVHFQVEDPDPTATAVTITGPGIDTSLSLVYDSDGGSWNSWSTNQSLDFGDTPPASPLEYTFTIEYSSGVIVETSTVESFVSVYATDLSTTVTETDPMVFSWTGVGPGYTYQVQLSDAAWNRIWDSDWGLTGTSVSYDGPSLTPGAQYHHWVVVEDQYGNSSFAEGSFTYQFTQPAAGPGDVDNRGSVNLADAILALKVVAGMTPTGVNLGADVNEDNKIGLAEVIYILQYVAGLRTSEDILSVPTSVSSVEGDVQAIISWNTVSGATSYNIYWATTSGVTKTNGTKITGATSPYTHTGLTNGTTYYYIVTAVNSQGESAASAQVSSTPATPSSGWIQTELNAGIGRSLYATDTEIYAATYDGVFSTIDDGMPWFSKGFQWVNVSDVIKSPEYLLAATFDGVYRSSDNGNTWLLSNGSPGVSAGGGIYGPHVFAKNSTYVFIIAAARGIFRSADDGENWEQVLLGQDAVGDQDYAASATFIYTVGEKIFISGSAPSTSGTGGNGIWSSSDNGNNWNYTQYPGDGDVQSLCYDNGKLFACGDMGVYLSTDLGNSWSTQYSNTFIGTFTFRNIISYNQNLIAAVDFNSIYISSDDGVSWTSFNDGLVSDWTFTGLAIKPPYIWALRSDFANAYRRPLTDIIH